MRSKKNKKKLIYIPIISGLIVLGIWAGPSLEKFNFSVEDGEIKSEISLTMPEESVAASPAATPEKDWQKMVTWGIGALNGLLGVVLVGKKIFEK
jgi:hypothetical protein